MQTVTVLSEYQSILRSLFMTGPSGRPFALVGFQGALCGSDYMFQAVDMLESAIV